MITPILRKSIALSLFENSDLGGKSREIAIQCVIDKTEYPNPEKDPITAVIVNAVNDADDMDELQSNFRYAIDQLNKSWMQAINGDFRSE